MGLPAIIRPSFTLGGAGGGIAYTDEEFDKVVSWGLQQSPRHQILLEQSVLDWKEFELEVMRDTADNVVIICSIENFDPMGVHTGDSITVAPAQTLTDKEYQEMRTASLAIIREIGVDTGGSNIQFAVNPKDGAIVVIEMNPRVSRSSALASKATGFPIAKIAAKLAVGYTLDEIPNDITKETPASFEPTIDYVVTKIPRFTFEKFPQARLDAHHPDEIGRRGDGDRAHVQGELPEGDSLARDRTRRPREPTWRRAAEPCRSTRCGRRSKCRAPSGTWCGRARRCGAVSASRRSTRADADRSVVPAQPAEIVEAEKALATASQAERAGVAAARERNGFLRSPARGISGTPPSTSVRALRHESGVRPVYKRVDTCGAEFEAYTPYLYSTYEQE